MGALLSRFDRETYYANYEKAFTKLEKTKTDIQKRATLRQRRRQTVSRGVLTIGILLTLCSSVYASWVAPSITESGNEISGQVFQREPEEFSAKGRILRLSSVILVPTALALVHYILLTFLDMLQQWDSRQLRKLQKSMETMIRDLKDRNRYSKIQELLEKYDPEERKKQALLEKLKTAPSAAVEPREEPKSSGRIGSSLIFGAGKLIDSVANRIIGDQPELLAEIEKLRSVLDDLEQKNADLHSENAALKSQLETDSPSPRVPSQPTSHQSGEAAE